jgi:hypothetical protein
MLEFIFNGKKINLELDKNNKNFDRLLYNKYYNDIILFTFNNQLDNKNEFISLRNNLIKDLYKYNLKFFLIKEGNLFIIVNTLSDNFEIVKKKYNINNDIYSYSIGETLSEYKLFETPTKIKTKKSIFEFFKTNYEQSTKK